MTEEIQYYLPAVKVNFKTKELVIEGNDIQVEGYTYRRVTRRLRGRQIERRLTSIADPELKFVLYK